MFVVVAWCVLKSLSSDYVRGSGVVRPEDPVKYEKCHVGAAGIRALEFPTKGPDFITCVRFKYSEFCEYFREHVILTR
jgi:hypothetical protein